MALLIMAISAAQFKKLYTAQKARDNQFFFQNVLDNDIFKIFKMFKNSS